MVRGESEHRERKRRKEEEEESVWYKQYYAEGEMGETILESIRRRRKGTDGKKGKV